ncbi:hypothetical protein BJ165DRAFT_1397545 [Panaeolus papilionaceus]|nr:hypothetical protein BJ165DRAFT_1397545 [Panaeolus papilionaceus]
MTSSGSVRSSVHAPRINTPAPMELDSFAEDWNHWPRYREKIMAHFWEQNIPALLDISPSPAPTDPDYNFTFRRGAWYREGYSMPCFPWQHHLFREYAKAQSKGNLVFQTCLPPAIYDQVIQCNTVREKWVHLHELYDEFQAASRSDAARSPEPRPDHDRVESIAPTVHSNPSISNKANDFLLDRLKNYPKYGDSIHPSTSPPSSSSSSSSNPTPPTHTILEHLTYLQILYEGLISRSASITEPEFISIIHSTLSRVPTVQAFVRFLDNQAKRTGQVGVGVSELVEAVADYEETLGREGVGALLKLRE